jgi:hypothetical protein
MFSHPCFKQLSNALLLALFFAAAPSITAAKETATSIVVTKATPPVFTTQQGLHTWDTKSGKLFMVSGTYQDTTNYRRSISFYFKDESDPTWLQVPIIESAVDYTTAWTSASSGETTLRDAIVIARGMGIYLIIAELDVKKTIISVSRYQFSSAGEKFLDGPGKLFIPKSAKTYQLSKIKSIEDALNLEIKNFRGD